MKNSVWLILLMFLTILSCSKDDDQKPGDKDNENKVFEESCNALVQQGLVIRVDGDNMSQVDMSNPETINEYAACISQCEEDDPNCMMDCSSKLGVIPSGAPFGVVCYIENTTTSPITFKLEPGDWFQPSTDDFQPMLCVLEIDVVIEPGEEVTEIIPVYCLNSGLAAPDTDSDYTICKLISSSDCLSEIISILKTKDIELITYAQATKVQEIIWDCTNGMSVDFDFLNSLPKKN